jgi:hypothetical protein
MRVDQIAGAGTCRPRKQAMDCPNLCIPFIFNTVDLNHGKPKAALAPDRIKKYMTRWIGSIRK